MRIIPNFERMIRIKEIIYHSPYSLPLALFEISFIDSGEDFHAPGFSGQA